MSKEDKLFKIRHSTAHLLAYAVKELYPNVKISIGPVVEDGFYYDFDFGKTKISEEDLPKIEKKMQQLAKKGFDFVQEWWDIKKAKEFFKNEPYKLEIIEEIEKGERDDFGQKGKVSVYISGDFIDLCKGPHVKNIKEIKAFKLLKIAGAYWKGDEKRPMLTRIYGTAFENKKKLEDYLKRLEEAKKYDHRVLGKQLDLFTFSPLVGAGLPLWTPRGTILRELLDNYIWSLRKKYGYVKVEIPHITKKDLYETSGHWEKFKNDLFKIKTREGDLFALKPMNCPHHTQIFARRSHSWREMPQRYANTTMVYRDEQSGELLGLARVRSITQDDAHVFCRKSQIEQEFEIIWSIVDKFYSTFNLPLKVRLSFHDPKHPENYLGDEKIWKKAEESLEKIAKKRGADYFIAPGEAAFYGPKLDFIAKDSLGREWQVATIQLDMNMPERFDLYCINEKGEKERIVMIHAAIMGSIERFTAMLLEHTKGKLPFWLSPVQIVIIPVADKHLKYAEEVKNAFEKAGFRVETDDKKDTVSKKILRAQEQKIPYVAVVGDKEEKEKAVNLRDREGKQEKLKIDKAIDILQKENAIKYRV